MPTKQCPDKHQLYGFVVGTIAEADADLIAEHLDTCVDCETVVQSLEGRPDALIAALQRPATENPYGNESECRSVLDQVCKLKLHHFKPAAGSTTSETVPKRKSRKVSSLGDYKILKKLGEGGMGAVYKSR